ncbi:MAG: hypothetical protein P0116_13820 [Candidatus Nitrosocosmicus sp.]|nr:hypothetical protein [Candidatus Nitrosocosmicus sp.]
MCKNDSYIFETIQHLVFIIGPDESGTTNTIKNILNRENKSISSSTTMMELEVNDEKDVGSDVNIILPF